MVIYIRIKKSINSIKSIKWNISFWYYRIYINYRLSGANICGNSWQEIRFFIQSEFFGNFSVKEKLTASFRLFVTSSRAWPCVITRISRQSAANPVSSPFTMTAFLFFWSLIFLFCESVSRPRWSLRAFRDSGGMLCLQSLACCWWPKSLQCIHKWIIWAQCKL